MAAGRPPDAYRFGPFRLSVPDRILERNGERVQLTPKVIDTLFLLVEHAGQVVTKKELMKGVWPDVTVVESGLTRNISALRKALEDGLEEGSFIETIPRRGYRFVGEVTEEHQPEIHEAPPVELRRPRPRWPWIAASGGRDRALNRGGLVTPGGLRVSRPPDDTGGVQSLRGLGDAFP